MSILKSPEVTGPTPGQSQTADAESLRLARRRPALDVARGLVLFVAFATTTPSWTRALGQLPASETQRLVAEQTAHAEWNGFHFLDWGFPAFIIMLAASMTLSHERRRSLGEPTTRFVGRVLLRGALLWLYAFFLYGGFSVPFTQIYFAHVFFLLSACIVLTGLSLAVLNLRGQLIAFVLALIGNWAFMALLPVPGYGSGNYSAEGNALQHVEHLLVVATGGTAWHSASLRHFDEDLVTLCGLTVMAYGTCLSGLLQGQILLSKYSIQRQVVILAICGIAGLNLALLWDVWFPINKHLWNASFTLFTAGLCYFVFAGLVELTEVWQFRRLVYPFSVFGRYPLAAWTCYFLLPWENFAQRLFGSSFPPVFGSYQPLVIDITQVLLCWLLFVWWDRRRAAIESRKHASSHGDHWSQPQPSSDL